MNGIKILFVAGNNLSWQSFENFCCVINDFFVPFMFLFYYFDEGKNWEINRNSLEEAWEGQTTRTRKNLKSSPSELVVIRI